MTTKATYRAGRVDPRSGARSQCKLIRFTDNFELKGIQPSSGSTGDTYDNAIMETNGRCRTERVRTTVFHNGPFKTIADIEYSHR